MLVMRVLPIVGMPKRVGVGVWVMSPARRRVSARLSWRNCRVRSSPSISPSQPCASAWARRVSRSVWISSSRVIISGSTWSMGQRIQACSYSHGGGVGASAVAEFDLPFVEVAFELVPLFAGHGPVFAGWSSSATGGEVGLVVPDDVFVEDGHVAVGGLQVEVAEQGCADVDGEPVVDQVGGEEASEVVRCEPTLAEFGVFRGEGVAELGEFVAEGAGGDDLGALPDGPLEQERLRRAGDAFVVVVAGCQRYRRAVVSEATDDGGDDVEQFRAHRDDAFLVGLGRGDHEQGDHLAVGPLVLADAELCEFEEFLAAQSGVGEGLHRGPLPERGVFGECDVDGLAGGEVEDPDVRMSVDPGCACVAGGVEPLVARRPDPRLLSGLCGRGGLQELLVVVATVADRGEERGEEGLQGADAGVHSFLGAPVRRFAVARARVCCGIGLGATQRPQRSGSAAAQPCRSR